VVNYEDSACGQATESFPTPTVCVPCPDLTTPTISQVDCTNTIDYDATFTAGSCTPFDLEFTWTFFLNDVEVGAVTIGPTTDLNTDLSGQFVYDGSEGPLTGDFKAVLTYDGSYNNGNCSLPGVTTESIIMVDVPPAAPASGGDQEECFDTTNPQTLTATATAGTGENIVWYDAETDGNVVPNPILDAVGTETYWAEAVSNDNNVTCSSSTRTPVTLTLYNCSIAIEKTASPDDPNNCNPIPAGDDITYTFTVTNIGNIGIGTLELNDALIDNTNPIPGPDSGD